jgi:hypothetical protein
MNILLIGMFVPCEFKVDFAYPAVDFIFIDHIIMKVTNKMQLYRLIYYS